MMVNVKLGKEIRKRCHHHVTSVGSHFFTELNINHHSLFIIMHDAFDIADPSSTQDACHT